MQRLLMPIVAAVAGGLVGFYLPLPGVLGFAIGMILMFVVMF